MNTISLTFKDCDDNEVNLLTQIAMLLNTHFVVYNEHHSDRIISSDFEFVLDSLDQVEEVSKYIKRYR